MNVNIYIFNALLTLFILGVYSYGAWRWLGVGKLMTEYKKAYSVLGEKSGDSRRTKMLEEAVMTGMIREENPLLLAAYEWVSPMLEAEGIDVQPRDFMLLLKSDQVQQLLAPLLESVEIMATPDEETGRYDLRARRRRRRT